MTVSRVLNSENSVRESTRATVLEAMARLKYAPNASARALASGKGARIGLLYVNPSSGYLSQLLIGALSAANERSAHLMVEGTAAASEKLGIESVLNLLQASIEAAILPTPVCEDHSILNALRRRGVKIVTIGRGLAVEDAMNIRIDDSAAASELTDYLLELGHRRIALITGHPAISASHERERGFRARMASRADLDCNLITVGGDFTYASGVRATEQLLDRSARPTAIFASNDEMAVAAINTAHRRGLQVPDNISIVGFDDTSAAETVWPSLTTIRQPVAMMAREALNRLADDIGNGRRRRSLSREIVLPYRLIKRESAAAPPPEI